jgi:hypothetical protein
MFIQEVSLNGNYQVLPPECQTKREIDAIQRDPRLIEKLGNQLVQEIRKVEGGYVVITDLCEMKVDVKYLPPSRPDIIGEPTRFELEFHDPIYFND